MLDGPSKRDVFSCGVTTVACVPKLHGHGILFQFEMDLFNIFNLLASDIK
jgi:hypothetical protein